MLKAMLAVLVAALLVVAVVATRRRPPASGDRKVAARDSTGEVTMIDPRELLYSLPTIHDAIPVVGPRAAGAATGAAILHEDDWRQEEFVARANAEYVARTLEAIRSHRAAHAVGIGFLEVYARKEPPVALFEAGVTRDDLTRVMGASDRAALYFDSREPKPVDGGFTLQIPGGGC